MSGARAIEIIGGGLAGLSLGLALRRAGVHVTLLEAGDYPRHRVCGEFITGLPARTRARLELDPFLANAAANHDVAWFLRDVPLRTQSLPAAVPGLSRFVLDARLAEAFVAAGGDLRVRTRCTDEADAPGRVFATGRRRAPTHSPRWLGLKIHAAHLPLAGDLELHLGDDAYVGLAKIESGRVNICGLFSRRPLCARGPDLLLGYLAAAGLTSLADRLAASPLDPDSFCAVAALAFDSRVHASDRLQLGDTCATIPPFTGHGMAMALQSAELALDPLCAYARGEISWSDTRRHLHAGLRRRLRVRLATAAALHGFLLRSRLQRCFAFLTRTRLLPLRPIYAVLH